MSYLRKFSLDVQGDTYAGELALPYVTAAVKSGDSIANGYVDVMDGINHKAVIKNLVIGDPVVAGGNGNCNFNDQDSMDLTEQVLTLQDLRVNEQICRGEIFPTFLAANNKMERNGELPADFQEFLLGAVASKVAESIEVGIWQGGTGTFGTGFLGVDGSTTQETELDAGACLDTGSGFTEVDFTAGACSASTILANLAATYDGVVANASGMLRKTGFGFYMNLKTYGFYIQALAGANSAANQGFANGLQNQQFNAVTYFGFPVYPCPGMPDDVIVATYPENLKVGTSLQTDTTEVRIIPTYAYDGSDNIRITMRFGIGVQTAVKTDGVVGSSLFS